MIEISNRQFDQIVNKLPHILDLARAQNLSLKQLNDIRQLRSLINQLQKKKNMFNNKN